MSRMMLIMQQQIDREDLIAHLLLIDEYGVAVLIESAAGNPDRPTCRGGAFFLAVCEHALDSQCFENDLGQNGGINDHPVFFVIRHGMCTS